MVKFLNLFLSFLVLKEDIYKIQNMKGSVYYKSHSIIYKLVFSFIFTIFVMFSFFQIIFKFKLIFSEIQNGVIIEIFFFSIILALGIIFLHLLFRPKRMDLIINQPTQSNLDIKSFGSEFFEGVIESYNNQKTKQSEQNIKGAKE